MTVHGIILAAGLGRRHRQLTNPFKNRYARPKAMLPVGNRVLIDFSIEALKKLGVETIHVGAGPTPRSAYNGNVEDIVAKMERHITNQDTYEINIRMHREREILDTAGTVSYLMEHFLVDVKSDDTICVLPCDTPHNIDLNPILQAHLDSNAAVTIAALPIQWSSKDWDERTFGTIRLADMPDIQKYSDRNLFEEDVRQWAKERQGQSFKVTGFHEQQSRDLAQSNLINIGIYFFRAGFLMDLAPSITPKKAEYRFSDFGLHAFPLLGGRFEEFRYHGLDLDFVQKIKRGYYPFFAYFLPVEETYWRDIADPLTLFRVNMDVLAGRFRTQLDPKFWHQQQWGWQGNYRASVRPGATIHPPSEPGSIGSIIGSHVKIMKTAEIEGSIILDRSVIEGQVKHSIVFPGTENERMVIGRGVKIDSSIYTGGQLTFREAPREIVDSIVYFDPDGGFGFAPIAKRK